MNSASIDNATRSGLTPPDFRRFYLAALAVIVAAGAFLRFWNLGIHSLWLDEAWLANSLINGKSLGDVVFVGPGNVPNSTPFLTSIAIHYITRFAGDSEWALRFLPALFSVAAIVTMYTLVRRFGGAAPTALLASMLVAFNPAAIDYAQELKQYAGDTFWLPLFFVCVLSHVGRPSWGGAVVLGFGGLVMLGFSQVIVLALPGASILLAFSAIRGRSDGPDRRVPRELRQALVVVAIWGIGSLAMYFLIFRHQSSGRLVNFWNEYFPDSARPSDIVSHLWLQVPRFFEWFFGPAALAASIVTAMGLIYLLFVRTVQTLLLVLSVLCVALGFSALRIFPFGGVRVNLYMLALIVLTMVFGLEAIVRACRVIFVRRSVSDRTVSTINHRRTVLVTVALGAAAVVLAIPVFGKQLSDPKHGSELRPLVEQLLSEFRDGDVVLLYDGRTEPAFDYYTRHRHMSYGVLRPDWSDEEFLVKLGEFAAGRGRVWIPMGCFDPMRADEIMAIVGQRWPSLVVVEGRGAKLAFFDADTFLTMLPKSSLEIVTPNHRDTAFKMTDDDPKTRWASHGPRQSGWSMEIGLVKPAAPHVIVLTAPNYPPDWSRELHVSYVHSTGDGWRSDGASVHVGPRTVILFDSTVGAIERVRVTNLETSAKFCWSIHEIEVWVPEAGE